MSIKQDTMTLDAKYHLLNWDQESKQGLGLQMIVVKLPISWRNGRMANPGYDQQ
jgi:hypothetical protein